MNQDHPLLRPIWRRFSCLIRDILVRFHTIATGAFEIR